MLHDLFEDHRKIVAAAEELLSFVRKTPDFRIEDLSQMRMRLSGISMAHLRAEEDKLIGPLSATGQLGDIPGAKAALDMARNVRSHYSDHIRQWTLQAIERDRAGYVSAVAVIVDMVKAAVEREEADLYWPALKLLAPDPRAANG